MNSAELLIRLKSWKSQTNFIKDNGDAAAIKKWQAEIPKIEFVLITALFREIPNLKEFEFKAAKYWLDDIRIFINQNQVPSLLGPESAEFKSWLVETNLKQTDLDLFMSVVLNCTTLCKDKSYFNRADFL